MSETTPNGSAQAVLVQRVSKLASERERSVGDQEQENRAEAEQNQWEIVRVFSEQRSASRFARSGREDWKQLTDDIRSSAYGPRQIVVLWEPSRGDRTPETWFRFLDACRESSTLIHVTSHRRTYDMQNWREWRTLAEDGVDSAVESEKTSERSRRGIRANVQDGKPHGKIPYGYERVYDPRTKKLERQQPHPDQAPIVAEIKRRVAAGEPVRAIVRDLNDRHIPTATGVPWSHQVVRQIAVNPVYIGRRIWRGSHGDGREHPGGWPPLIDEETHHAAVAVLKSSRQSGRRPGRDKYLLSFLAVCGVCGKPLMGAAAGPSAMPGYKCPTGCVMTRAPWLDAFVSRLVIRRLSEPETYERLTAPDDGWRSAARSEAAALEARLQEAADAFAAGRIGIEALQRVEETMRPSLEAVRKRLEIVTVSGPVQAMLAPRGDIEARWKAALVPQRKAVVRALFLRIALKPGKPGAPRGSRAKFDPERVDWEWR